MKVPKSHPCYGCHFPGNPIVPGVVILQKIIDNLQQAHEIKVVAIRQFKFLQKLQAEQAFNINIMDIQSQCIHLTVTCGTKIIAKGEFMTQDNVI